MDNTKRDMNSRGRGYQSRPIADVRSRFRTTAPVQSVKQNSVDGVVKQYAHPKPVPVATTQHTKQAAPRQQAQVPKQKLSQVQTQAPLHQHAYMHRQHVSLSNVPTLPIGGNTRFKKLHKKLTKPHMTKKIALVVGGALILVVVSGVLIKVNTTGEEKIVAQATNSLGEAFDTAQDIKTSAALYSEVQPQVIDMKSYKVASDAPKFLIINKAIVWSRVVAAGLNPTGQLRGPINIYDATWYNKSAKPGQDGVMVFTAHAKGPTTGGILANLNKIKIGDLVGVTGGDGTEYHYRVVAIDTVNSPLLDMTKLLKPYNGAKQGLVVTTYNGNFLQETPDYNKHMVVYATREQQ